MAIKKQVEKAAKEVAAKAVEKVKDAVVDVNNEFEGEIDPYLVKWAKHPLSGWLSVGFGVGLLLIGGILGAIIF